MAKRIALFNHKAGVSKTTTTFHMGWMLASKGYRVVLVDADPQCNLSGLVLGFKGEDEFENFYQLESDRCLLHKKGWRIQIEMGGWIRRFGKLTVG